jgi:hypothetical protein
MEVIRHTDPIAFIARAEALLLAHEACNNIIFGICNEVARNPKIYGDEPPVLRTVEEAGIVLLAALQTPPYRMQLSHSDHPAAIDHLIEALAAEGRVLPGIIGPRPLAERFAAAWAARTGVGMQSGTAQRIYQLTSVRPPSPAPGRMRPATEADRPLLQEWFVAFQREALNEANPGDGSRTTARWLDSPYRQLVLWEDGAPMSLAGAAGPTPNGIRISAVYTPPAHRRRGYASSLVAALSQAQLDSGRRFCFLYTDLGNPTSNKIYQEIGYEPVVDIAEQHFV